jgi:hypothetical protein
MACSSSSTAAKDKPLKHFEQEITSEAKMVTLKPGQQVFIPIKVKNIGAEFWASKANTYPVHLGYLLFDGSKQLDINTPRTFLPSDLAPGTEQTLKAVLIGPPTRGIYTARFTMVQERAAWFTGTGAPSLNIPVTVN